MHVDGAPDAREIIKADEIVAELAKIHAWMPTDAPVKGTTVRTKSSSFKEQFTLSGPDTSRRIGARLYGLISWIGMGLAGLVIVWRAVEFTRRRRFTADQCQGCGDPLGEAGACSECDRRIPATPTG
ncbi:MAG: hypothetical protein AB8G96_04370 [Phycisphaerales bacterium]